MPSVVYFGPDGRVLVGRLAEHMLEHPKERCNVISSVKRELASRRAWPVAGKTDQPRQVGTVKWSPRS